MKWTCANIGLKFALVFLLLCMSIPSSLKLAHAIHGHPERECTDDTRLHFHSTDFDCVFHKFKVATSWYHAPTRFDLWVPTHTNTPDHPDYSFLPPFQPLSFALRAPPGA